jgi:hypothetical protein
VFWSRWKDKRVRLRRIRDGSGGELGGSMAGLYASSMVKKEMTEFEGLLRKDRGVESC